MIAPRKPECTISADVFGDAHKIVWESGVAELIDDQYRASCGDGGRKPDGITYTVIAVLVALQARILMKRPPTLCGVMDTIIGEFTPDQLAAVGMGGQDCANAWDRRRREYRRFTAWWARRLVPFDSWADLPARRMTNSTYREYLENRTEKERKHAAQAERLLHIAINRIVAASVDDSAPKGCRGDLVVDGTLYKVAKSDGQIGSADDKLHGAVACASFHVRDKRNKVGTDTTRQITYSGMTIEVTALTRIGKPDALHSIPLVFVGIAIHYATSGSVEGLADAWEQAEANDLIPRPDGPRSRWPFLTTDMAYNSKDGFSELVLEHRYSPVARFPEGWGIECPSAKPAGSSPSEPEPGPLQWAGAFYCPAVLSKIKGHRTPDMDTLLQKDEFRRHDQRLRRIQPYLMGYNSQPFFAETGHGRPPLGKARDRVVKQKLVCPAAMGNLKCPLKPESMRNEQPGIPETEPTWQAHERACCAKSSATVTLTPAQLKRAQWGMVPGFFDHGTYFEATRALTEQRFSQLKSEHITGLSHLTFGPRREPMIKLILAMAVAAANRASQRSHDPSKHRVESIDVRMRQLADDLGHEPTRTPPRT